MLGSGIALGPWLFKGWYFLNVFGTTRTGPKPNMPGIQTFQDGHACDELTIVTTRMGIEVVFSMLTHSLCSGTMQTCKFMLLTGPSMSFKEYLYSLISLKFFNNHRTAMEGNLTTTAASAKATAHWGPTMRT